MGDNDNKKESPYKSCFMFSNECGPYSRFKKPIDDMFTMKEITGDVRPHLNSLKIINNFIDKCK